MAVGDDNSREPAIQDASESALNGRGMALVDACATEWGVAGDAYGGKVVWCECDATPGGPSADR